MSETLRDKLARYLYVANEAETGALTWSELQAAGAIDMREHYLAVADGTLALLAATAPTPDEVGLVGPSVTATPEAVSDPVARVSGGKEGMA